MSDDDDDPARPSIDWPIMDQLAANNDALRARVAKLEDDLEAARRCARLAQDAHDIVCARVAKLEAALLDCKRYAEDHDDEWVPFTVDDALQDAPR